MIECLRLRVQGGQFSGARPPGPKLRLAAVSFEMRPLVVIDRARRELSNGGRIILSGEKKDGGATVAGLHLENEGRSS